MRALLVSLTIFVPKGARYSQAEEVKALSEIRPGVAAGLVEFEREDEWYDGNCANRHVEVYSQ